MNRKYWIIALVAVLVAACGDETPTQVDVEVKVDADRSRLTSVKTWNFIEKTKGRIDEMWAWCKTASAFDV